MSLDRNIRLITAHGLFTHMLFLLPVVYPYYQSIGLSFRDFLIGEAVFSAVILLCEIPSGWISDVWRRRTTLVLGGFFALCGFSLLMAADNFWMATIAQGTIGIAVALNSGTNTSLLYDLMHEEGKDSDFRRVDGHRHGISFYGTALACAAGGFLFVVHPKLPLFFDMCAITAAMVSIAMVREPKRFMKAPEKNLLRDMAQTMKYALSGHPEIAGIIMVAATVLCTTKLMLWTQQPYYAQAGLSVQWYGVILTVTFILGGMAGQLSHRIEHWGSNRAALGFMAGILIIACVTLALINSVPLGVVLFFTGTLAYAMGQPRVNAGIHSRVGPERRATIMSTANLMVHLLFIPTSVIVGAMEEWKGVSAALFWIAGQLFVLAGAGLWLWGRNTNLRAE
jgi:MFS family permease